MTSTDLALTGGGDVALTLPSSDLGTLDQLKAWLEAAHVAEQIAAVVCAGPFAPKGFRGNKESTATAILAGMELGFSPSRALRSFYVVEGTATLSAEAMRALILARGHEFEVTERSPERVVVRGRRRGETDWTEVTWTIEDAIRAKLVERGADGTLKGSRDPWWKYPATMLANRATTDLGKLKFADVIGGMDSPDEVLDRGPETVGVEVVDQAPRVSAAAILAAQDAALAAESAEADAEFARERADRAAAAVQPVADLNAAVREAAEQRRTAVPAEPGVERMVLPVSKGQLDALKTRFEELNLGGRAAAQRAARMRVLSELVSREIDDPRALTNDEAKTCLDNLAGQNGVRVCVDLGVLTEPADPDRPTPTPLRHVDGPTGDELDRMREEATDDYDPTTGADWPMDGAEAAAEGS